MIPNDNLPDLAADLVRIHTVISRGLAVGLEKGAEFQRTGFPDLATRAGFADYLLALTVVLAAHHLGEDEVAFPALRARLPSIPYERLAADHQKAAALIDPLRQALNQLSGEGKTAGLVLLVEGLSRLSELWGPHIAVEEQYFSRPALAEVMDMDEQGRLSAALGKHNQEHATPGYLALPFVLFNLEGRERAAMAAAMPEMVTGRLIPTVWKEQWAPMKPFLLD